MRSLAKLYFKAGDKNLIVNNDYKTALSYYKLAGLLWDQFKPKNDSKLNYDEKYNAFNRLMLGNYDVDLQVFDCKSKDTLKTQFENCAKSIENHEDTAIDNTNVFLNTIGNSFDTIDDKARLSLIMVASIRKNFIIDILFLLSNESDNVKNRYRLETMNAKEHLTEKKYQALYNWISKKDISTAHKVLLFVNVIIHCEKLISLLRVKPGSTITSAYYTSYNTFSLMSPDKCIGNRSDECGKLSVMNISYMNDPNEGITVRNFIYNNKLPQVSRSARLELKSPYVFRKCFTSMIDYLPMWQMYGNSGEGVCLVIEWENKEEEVSLYHICYLNKSNGGYTIRKNDNPSLSTKEIGTNLRAIKQISFLLREQDEQKVLDSLIEPIVYLFKDNSYSYEQEMRIMYRFDKSSPDIKHTPQEPPMLFVIHQGNTRIKEIILGSKFRNTSYLLPYLNEQLEKMSEINEIEPPIITLSSIDFR